MMVHWCALLCIVCPREKLVYSQREGQTLLPYSEPLAVSPAWKTGMGISTLYCSCVYVCLCVCVYVHQSVKQTPVLHPTDGTDYPKLSPARHYTSLHCNTHIVVCKVVVATVIRLTTHLWTLTSPWGALFADISQSNGKCGVTVQRRVAWVMSRLTCSTIILQTAASPWLPHSPRLQSITHYHL